MEQLYNGLPRSINSFTPEPKENAVKITALVKQAGKVTGYALSDGKAITKQEGVAMAKSGDIRDVGVATRNGNEYLRSLADGAEGNNLSNLPSIPADEV